MANRKFAVGAWFFTILLVAVLSGIIGFFYYNNFPLRTSLPYFGAVIFLATISIWLTKYHDEPGEAFTRASFICKCFLLLLMAVNAAFCFHLGRQMSVGRTADASAQAQEKAFNERIESLKSGGPKAKLELAKAVREHKPASVTAESDAFAANENYAFAIMIAEFVSGAGVVMLMMGLMIFVAPKPKVETEVYFDGAGNRVSKEHYEKLPPAPMRPVQSPALSDEWAEVQRTAAERSKPPRGHFDGDASRVTRHARNDASPSDGGDVGDASPRFGDGADKGMIWLRGFLQGLAREGHFYFKAERKKNGVLVRQVTTNAGREVYLHSYMFSHNIANPKKQIPMRRFLAQLQETLVKRGFNLEYEKGATNEVE